MTILMTVAGFFVFIVSLFTRTFKVAFKRQLMFTLTGFTIDMLLVALAGAVLIVTHN
jgi:hypothetical protein